MKILGIDSSGIVASVAAIEDDILLGEYTINHKKTHSQTLLPMLDKMLGMLELEAKDFDAIAVAAGPGSFTGLRIGSATAKGLALVTGVDIIEVPTVDALAYNLTGNKKLVCPIMDARRNQVYTGIYEFDGAEMHTLMEQTAMDIEELIQKLTVLNQPVTFLGDGVPVFRGVIDEKLSIEHDYAPSHCNRQHAGAVAALGALLYKQGESVSAREHKPEYLRMSQAERERLEKEKGAE